MTSLLKKHLPSDIVHIIQKMLMISEEEVMKKHRMLMKDIKALCVCPDCFSANCSEGIFMCPICRKTCNVCNHCNLYLCNHFMVVSKL